MKNREKIDKAYDFFYHAEISGLRFTLEEICNAAGWKMQTVRNYRSKKWHSFLKMDEDKFYCEGICGVHKNSFARMHSQRADDDSRNLRPRFDERVDVLIDKAKESALLAVQAYNNPLTVFRTPGYLVLMNIAFTALFHAIYEYKGIDYTYKNSDGTPKIVDGETAAWELSMCAKQYYGSKSTPERANLDILIPLRNKIEHRFIPQLDMAVAGHCQAMLLNFEKLLTKEFGVYFSLGQSLALALQFSQIAPEQKAAIKRIQAEEYVTIRQYIEIYQNDLSREILESQDYSFRVYLIPRIGNHASSSDAAVQFVHYDPNKPEEMELIMRQVALIKEQRIQVANQGKLKPKDVVERICKASGVTFNTTYHTNAWKLYNVRPKEIKPQGCNTKYCQYDEPHRDFVYTDEWVTFLIKQVNNSEEYERIKSYRDVGKRSKRATS